MSDAKQTVLVVIPALNEEAHIASVIKSIPRAIEATKKQFNTVVVVVDDGSTDATAEKARAAGAIVLSHVVNTGAGGATRTGLRFAEQCQMPGLKYIVTIDGDGQHASDDVERLVAFAVKNKSQFVVGNRLHDANKTNMPATRKLANWAASLLSRVLFDVRARDTQSGLRLYDIAIVPQISDFTLDRYGFCTETLWHAVRAKIRVDEVPIAVHYSKEVMAKGQSVWSSLEVVRDLIRIRIAG